MQQEKIEIRDIRKKEWFWVDDMFFNTYAKIFGPGVLAVYIALCRYADKEQKCFPSINRISDDIRLSRPVVIESLKILEYLKIIKKKRVGKTCNNRYFLLCRRSWRKDWEKIVGEVKLSEFTSLNKCSKAALLHWLSRFTSNSNQTHSKEKVLQSELKNSRKDIPLKIRKDIEIILEYGKILGVDLEDKEIQQSFIKRNLKAAGLLKGYPLEKVVCWLKILPHINLSKWTLETIGKYIDLDPVEVIIKYREDDYTSVLQELEEEGAIMFDAEYGYKSKY